MPRVLILEPSGLLWGSERALLDFLPQLAEFSQRETGVFCPKASAFFFEAEKISGLRLFGFKGTDLHRKTKLHRLGVLLQLLLAVKRFNPSVLHLNQAGFCSIALYAARIFRVPLVVHLRLYDDIEYIGKILLGPKNSLIKKIICVSRDVEIQLLKKFPEAAARTQAIYDAYRFVNEHIAACESMRIACAGRLAPSKGQHLLIEALGILRRENIIIETEILGLAAASEEKYAAELKNKAAALGLKDQIKWHGFHSNPMEVFRKVHCVIFPSIKEPLGRVIFEAWDAGTIPVASSLSGGSAEIIEKSLGGFLFDTPSAAGLAAAIKKVIALSPREIRETARRGRAWAESACNPHQYAEKINRVWQEAACK